MALNGLIKHAARTPNQCSRSRRNAQQLSTAPTALNPTTGQITVESFLSSAQPAYGNKGRIVWLSDSGHLVLDTGTSWTLIN